MKLRSLKSNLQTIGSRLATVQSDSWRAGKETSTQRGYGYKWQAAREGYLKAHPLCVFCERDGRVTLAKVVDHIVPHKGDMTKFWDSGNWQPLCKPCHDGEKQRQERADRSA